jgi:hypothetical protein
MARKTQAQRDAEYAEYKRLEDEYTGPWACTKCLKVSGAETCTSCWKSDHMVAVRTLIAAYLNEWPDDLGDYQ